MAEMRARRGMPGLQQEASRAGRPGTLGLAEAQALKAQLLQLGPGEEFNRYMYWDVAAFVNSDYEYLLPKVGLGLGQKVRSACACIVGLLLA